MRVQGFGNAQDDARVSPLLSFVLHRPLVEAQWIVPCLPELAAADPAVHAALGGRATLAVRRGSEVEEVIDLWVFSFPFKSFFLSSGWFGVLPFGLFVCMVADRENCIFLDSLGIQLFLGSVLLNHGFGNRN